MPSEPGFTKEHDESRYGENGQYQGFGSEKFDVRERCHYLERMKEVADSFNRAFLSGLLPLEYSSSRTK